VQENQAAVDVSAGGEGEKGGKGGKRSREDDVSGEDSRTAPKRQKGDGC
jgi:hypothetical protein